MVRYFLCSNEQPLQFTAEVMRNFWPLLYDKVCLPLLLELLWVGMGQVDIWYMKNVLKGK